MLIDSHCHAWTTWPYKPVVPDPETRGRIEQLLHEMDENGVEQAVVICAQIDHNPDNNAYIAEQAQCHTTRIHQFPDVDSSWSPTYHTKGAADRLREIAERWPIKGFTHYLKENDDGAWLYSQDGIQFFEVAAQKRLIASISCRPHHQPAIRKLAQRLPSVPILCHHLGVISAATGPYSEELKELLASALLPNIFIKVSGFAYSSAVNWDYPYSDTFWLVRVLYEHFGAGRMCWGSDYPVVRFYMTYRQAIEVFRTHCTFVPQSDKDQILGGTLHRLLTAGSV